MNFSADDLGGGEITAVNLHNNTLLVGIFAKEGVSRILGLSLRDAVTIRSFQLPKGSVKPRCLAIGEESFLVGTEKGTLHFFNSLVSSAEAVASVETQSSRILQIVGTGDMVAVYGMSTR